MASGSIRAGRAFIELTLNSDVAFRQLQRFQRRFRQVGASLARQGASIAAAGGGLAALFVQPIREFSRFEQLEGRFNSVLGRMGNAGRQFSEQLAGDINQSSFELRDQIAQFQAIFRGFNFTPEVAFDLAKELTAATQDVIAFDDNITDAQEAVEKLSGAVAGSNVRGVRQYGANLLESALDTEIATGRIGRAYGELDEQQEKVIARVNILRDSFGRAGITGQAGREVDTLASVLRGAAAASRLAFVAVGQALGPAMVGLGKSASTALRGFADFVSQNRELVQVAALASVALFAVGATLVGIGVGVTVASIALGGLISLFTVLGSPIAVVSAAVIGLGVAVTRFSSTASRALEPVRTAFLNLFQSVRVIVNAIEDALSGGDIQLAGRILFAALEVIWRSGVSNLTEIFSGVAIAIVQTLAGAVEGVASIFIDAWGRIDQVWTAGAAGLEIAWLTFSNEILDTWSTISLAIQDAVSAAQVLSGGDAAREFGQIVARRIAQATDQRFRDNALEQRTTELAGSTLARIRAIEDQRQATQDQLGDVVESATGRLVDRATSRLDAAQGNLADAEERLASLTRQARDGRQDNSGVVEQIIEQLTDQLGGAQQRDVSQGVAFAGIASQVFGGGVSVAQQQLDTQRNIVKVNKQIAANTKKGAKFK